MFPVDLEFCKEKKTGKSERFRTLDQAFHTAACLAMMFCIQTGQVIPGQAAATASQIVYNFATNLRDCIKFFGRECCGDAHWLLKSSRPREQSGRYETPSNI